MSQCKSNPDSDGSTLKTEEASRTRIHINSYEGLDHQYGSSWTQNTLAAFNLSGPTLWQAFLKSHFVSIMNDCKETLREDSMEGDVPSSSTTITTTTTTTTTTVENIKNIVTTFQPILRRDLPDDIKTLVQDRITSGIQQQSDCGPMLSLAVELSMVNFALLGSDSANTPPINVLIPQEFRARTMLQVISPSSKKLDQVDHTRQSDYKRPSCLEHIQIINTANFGTSGVSRKTSTLLELVEKLQSSIHSGWIFKINYL